jgi:hypothetical protein
MNRARDLPSVFRSNLMVGFYGATSAPVWGFGPPSNVVAEVSPDLPKYELRRIGLIAFVNQSGTPDAGVRVANCFFHELDTYHRFELTPPLLLDRATELAFTRTAQAGPEEARADRLQRFVREWIEHMWPSTAHPSETSQGQTPARPGSPHQPPLLDNLLLMGRFLQGGGVWQTSDTLTRLGLERVIKTFPGIARSALP